MRPRRRFRRGCAASKARRILNRVTPTYGGYATDVVVDEPFVLRIPEGLNPAAAAVSSVWAVWGTWL